MDNALLLVPLQSIGWLRSALPLQERVTAWPGAPGLSQSVPEQARLSREAVSQERGLRSLVWAPQERPRAVPLPRRPPGTWRRSPSP